MMAETTPTGSTWKPTLVRVLRTAGRMLRSQVDSPEAAGLLHATASVGPSFESSLLPRTSLQQAGLTGAISAVNYGITVTLQSALEATAIRVAGRGADNPHMRTMAALGADLITVAAGTAAVRLLKQRDGESLWRAGLRTAAFRVSTGAVAGSIAVTADAALDTLTPHRTPGQVNAPAVLVAGAALGAGIHLTRSRRLLDTDAEADQYGTPVPRRASLLEPAKAIAVGAATSGGLYGLSRLESGVAGILASAVGFVSPTAAPAAKAIGHLLALGGAGLAIERGISYAYSRTEQAGRAIEPAYSQRPRSGRVSSSPASAISWESIGREGRRFVNMALTAEEIEDVTGRPSVDPIRVFVGYDSALSPNARAYLAMQELERTGAFDRPHLVVYAPTGSGYVNYVATETVEYLTDGNCASVAIQYSVRPSFLSLDRVKTAWESYLALLTALAWHMRALPAESRPRVMIYGESLGSQSAQDVFEKEGTQGFDILDVDRALFVGSPFASVWRRRWLSDPVGTDPGGIVVEVASQQEWNALPARRRTDARVFLLTHHRDPIPKFGASLLVQRPSWLGDPGSRPPGIARDTRFWPIFTFMLTAVDLLNADNVVPGTFEAFGHDYRQDIPDLVRIAYGFTPSEAVMADVQRALRRRELEWAERRDLADAAVNMERTVRDRLEELGVDHTVVPPLVATRWPTTADPYSTDAQDDDRAGAS